MADTRGGEGQGWVDNNFNWNLHFKEWERIKFSFQKHNLLQKSTTAAKSHTLVTKSILDNSTK